MDNIRKDEHINLARKQVVKVNYFDKIKLSSTDLPELSIDDIDLSTTFLGYKVSLPFYINAMTGGTDLATKINVYLAKLAKHFKIPFVLGSQSIALKDDLYAKSFKKVREHFDGILISNINPNYNLKKAKEAISMVNANGLSIHLNVIQELIMDEGDRNFKGWSSNILEIKKGIEIPLLIKQVGLGLSIQTIKKIKELGIKYIDVSGSGGTSFIDIESKRANKDYSYLRDFEIDTAKILIDLKDEKDLTLYASGGIRNPLDLIKSLVLGANAVGMSKFFLNLTNYPLEDSIKIIDNFIMDLKKIMIILGVKNISELKNIKYIIS